jgi:subtilisin family serine protease
MAAFLVVALAAAVAASQAHATKYVVLYKKESLPSDAAMTVKSAGGLVVASYPQIGVVIAQSDSPTFGTAVRDDTRVEGVTPTAGFGVPIDDRTFAASEPISDPPGGVVNDFAEPLFSLQWDMRQIHTPEAHRITGGSPEILVGDIDTGLDFNHPDLAPNYDAVNSTNCSSGAPTPLLPGNDQFGHGTHTAGTIAAAANKLGIIGVAPNVRIAGIKATTPDGSALFPEMIVCAFMWAATHGVDVTNNSYFADPWYFNCRNDPEQRAIWNAERRAIKFAMKQGVVVVAAAGNFADDLSHPIQDIISPDTGPFPNPRDITNACAVIPVEIPGVIGVSGDGNLRIKSWFSSYGSAIQVTAPGGDGLLQQTPEAPNGLVLSTIAPDSVLGTVLAPSSYAFDCSVSPCAKYAYLAGTSMAAPHVTGVAALIESRYGALPPGKVAAIIDQTADPIACPDAVTLALYNPFPQFSTILLDEPRPQTCTGGTGHNSWYGHGEVNALSAVAHQP